MAITVIVTSPAPTGSDCRIVDFLTNGALDTVALDPGEFKAHDPNLTLGSAIDLTIQSSLNNLGYDVGGNVTAGTIDRIVITSAADGIDRATLNGLNINAATLYNAMVADDAATLEGLIFGADAFNYTGDSGDDKFTGGLFGDIINGNAGNDTLGGSGGDDTLDGGDGNDILTGGFGNNTFKVSKGNDTVVDLRSTFFSDLTGAKQVPATGSGATAQANLDYDPVLKTLQLTIFTNGLDWDGAQTGTANDNVTGFHVHLGNAGTNGAIVWDIADDINTNINAAGGMVTSTWTVGDTIGGINATTFVNELLTDGLYLNIHTSQFGGGAVRGQIEHDANRIDLTSLNIGSLATWQAITADVSGNARMTTFDNGIASSLTLVGMPEIAFDAGDFIFAGNVAQIINGTNNIDYRFGAGGNDTINVLGGNDRVFGETGNDILNGGGGIDRVDGGSGNDTFRITGNEGLGDTFIGGAGADILRVFGTANATLSSFNATGSSIETWTGNGKGLVGTTAANSFNLSGLTAKSGLLFVNGGNGNDTIVGTRFADDLRGGNDNDRLTGGLGNDLISGGSGNDILTGGIGRDVMTGGAGADDFDINSIAESRVGSSRDVLNAFQRGLDDVDVRTVDAKTGVAGNQAFTFIGTQDFHDVKGELRYRDLGSTCIVQGDVNGDGRADFEILVKAAALARGDFLL
ncbi:MAG: CHRD domain-containing protein [Xanthobacteraceae bacterium]